MDELRFDGQVALVTGGGSGLGRQYATDLARRGAKVMVNSIDRSNGVPPRARAVAEGLRAEGYVAEFHGGDVGVQADAIAMVEKTVEVFGRIDILVNNAGAGAQTAIQDTTPEAFASLLNVHLFGSFCTMWAAVAHMRAQNYGRIVNTSSALGAFSAPAACAYSTAKAAILGMSKSAALDNEDKDIRINAILPVAQTSDGAKAFFAKRPEIDGDRLLTSRVSPAVMYLCHRICSLTGEAIAAGGGRVARVFTATGPGYYSDELTDQEVADNLETIMDTTGFRILREALDQHRLLPPRGTKRP